MKTIKRVQTTPVEDSDTLHYTFYLSGSSNQHKFSLRIEDSDWFANETILNALVGNLVKFGSSGKIEPYLAESYTVSENNCIWRYKIRSNLKCQNGEIIDAISFESKIKNQIKRFAAKTRPIEFEKLKGFKSFIEGSSNFEGIKSLNGELIFTFEKAPEDLNELLRMPYFGYWCDDNLNEDNKSSLNQFVSSGSYEVDKRSTSEEIILQKRSNWFSNSENSFKEIKFKYSNELSSDSKYSIIETTSNIDLNEDILESNIIIKGIPNMSLNLIFSPYFEGPLKDLKLRTAIRNKIRNAQKRHSYFNSIFFYSSAQSEVIESEFDSDSSFLANVPHTVIRIATLRSKNKDYDQIHDFLNEIFKDTKIEFEFIYPQEEINKWSEMIKTNDKFDARLNSVVNGAQIKNFIVKMIFCSELGVSYPDPSGRICKLVAEQDRIGGPIPDSYKSELNQIIYDDATLIPLFHVGTMWTTKNIDENIFPNSIVHPLFENLQKK